MLNKKFSRKKRINFSKQFNLKEQIPINIPEPADCLIIHKYNLLLGTTKKGIIVMNLDTKQVLFEIELGEILFLLPDEERDELYIIWDMVNLGKFKLSSLLDYRLGVEESKVWQVQELDNPFGLKFFTLNTGQRVLYVLDTRDGLMVFDTKDGKQVYSAVLPRKLATGISGVTRMEITPNNEMILLTSDDLTVYQYCSGEWTILRQVNRVTLGLPSLHWYCMVYEHDSQLIYLSDYSNTVTILRVNPLMIETTHQYEYASSGFYLDQFYGMMYVCESGRISKYC